MVGAIRTLDILSHPIVTIQCFGWGLFFRGVFMGQSQTFLSLLQKAKCLAPPGSDEPELIERCIGLELQASQIYESLAERFALSLPMNEFLAELAGQEREHADLLKVCRSAAMRGHGDANGHKPWHDYVPLLEQRMGGIVSSLTTPKSVEDTLRLVIEIESSEINQVFLSVIKATESAFVEKLRPFRKAAAKHIAYIRRSIRVLAPSLDCRDCGGDWLRAGLSSGRRKAQ
jgi:hypothetical protein